MKDLLRKFALKKPEIVFEWSDSETEAEGWVVINSLRGGSAGGGTRMRLGLDRKEVESLAKTMEVKFTVSGPPIGGAKSGINFDPHDPRKNGVLERWFKAVYPLLKGYYGTGGDLNVDEIHEVIPITEKFGLWHPQEGVVNGYYQANEPQKIKKLGQLRQGVSKVIENPKYSPTNVRKLKVADMITGYGVAESILHYYSIWGGTPVGKKALIQGWGNVGASAAYYLSQEGVKIVGIIDRAGGIIESNGISHKELSKLFLERKGNSLSSENIRPFEEINEHIWNTETHIFVPAAASRLVYKEQLEVMISNGLELIASGANVPFKDPETFMGPTGEFADNSISVIPDFIANCGMARVFAYLMDKDIEMTDESIFKDVSKTIHHALERVYEINKPKTKITQSAYQIALQQLV